MSLTGTFVRIAIRPSALAISMHLVLQPLADVPFAMRPREDTVALLLIIDVLT
jgi:hypothetical protein